MASKLVVTVVWDWSATEMGEDWYSVASVLRELRRSREEDGVMLSASLFDFVIRTGRAAAAVRSTLRMVAVLALEMVAEARMPEDTVAVLMKLSARSRRVAGCGKAASGADADAVRREDSGHLEDQDEDEEAGSRVALSGEIWRAPCSSLEEMSCVEASAHLWSGE